MRTTRAKNNLDLAGQVEKLAWPFWPAWKRSIKKKERERETAAAVVLIKRGPRYSALIHPFTPFRVPPWRSARRGVQFFSFFFSVAMNTTQPFIHVQTRKCRLMKTEGTRGLTLFHSFPRAYMCMCVCVCVCLCATFVFTQKCKKEIEEIVVERRKREVVWGKDSTS